MCSTLNRTVMNVDKLWFCLWQQPSVQPICVRLSPGLAGSVAEEDASGQRKPSLSEARLPEGDPHPGRGHPRLHMWRWASHGSYSATKLAVFGILCRIISCLIKILNKSPSAPHQAFRFNPDVTTVVPFRLSASPASYFCRRPRHLHPKAPIASVLGHTHSHPPKRLVRTARSASVKQQPQMTSACGFQNDVAITTTAAAAMAT